jgi:hypothetical protein
MLITVAILAVLRAAALASQPGVKSVRDVKLSQARVHPYPPQRLGVRPSLQCQ